jgi:hypothetical protein
MKPVIPFSIALVLLLSLKLQGQTKQGQLRHNIKSTIDSVILKAQNNSLNGHCVKWDSIKSVMYQKAAHAKTDKDLRPSLEVLLNSLKDHHGKFIDATTQTPLATFTAWHELTQHNTPEGGVRSLPVLNSLDEKFEFRLLDGSIGYLKLVSVSHDADLQKEAEIIRSAIDSLDKDELQGWIIDLRYNDGTNIHPILAGVAPLLGEGQVGGTVDGRNKIRKLYEIHNGNFYDDQHLVARFPCTKNFKSSKIAVLLSGYTASSGEIVAITLKQRKNTRFFGEPTRGITTATNRIRINNSLIMSISESLYQDRMGNVYTNNIQPDTFVAFVPSADPGLDQAIVKASDWLNGNGDQ